MPCAKGGPRWMRRWRKRSAPGYVLCAPPLSTPISEMFVERMENYALNHTLSIPDALIAASALHHDLPLSTRNVRDIRFISSLNLYGQTS